MKIIPNSVTHDQVMEALEPLHDLLGITAMHYYMVPGLTIGHDRITFTVPAVDNADEWSEEKPPNKVLGFTPQPDSKFAPCASLSISVKVVR